MKKLAAIFAVLLCSMVLSAGLFVGTGAASSTLTYHFYGCTGPSPTEFDAVKTKLPAASPSVVSAAAAFRLTDGSAIFVVLSFGEGNFSPPGISQSGAATVTCAVDFSIGKTYVSGL